MLAIYVSKKWVDSIGDAADFIAVTKPPGDYALLMAAEKSLSVVGPFLHVEVVRHAGTLSDKDKPFIPVKIPAALVVGIIDLTEAESRKIGFTA